MKVPLNNGGDLLKSPLCVNISALFFISIAFFYIGKHYSDVSYNQLLFFYSNSSSSPSVSLSPNFNKSFDVASLINSSSPDVSVGSTTVRGGSEPPPVLLSPPPAAEEDPVKRFGIVDENGIMTEDFEIGEYDPSHCFHFTN